MLILIVWGYWLEIKVTYEMNLNPGQRITAPFLPVPAEVKKFEPRSGYCLLEVVLQDGHNTFKPLRITTERLNQINILDSRMKALTGNAERIN